MNKGDGRVTLTEYFITNRINTEIQRYEGIELQCVPRTDYHKYRAKLFKLNGTDYAIWIPNKHLDKDGTLFYGENIDYVFRSERNRGAIISAGIDPHRFDRVHDMYPRRRGNREWGEWIDWANMTLND